MHSRRFFALSCAVALLAGSTASPRLNAELPPSAYEAMQSDAPEYLRIEVLRVDIEPGNEPTQQVVNAVALVTEVIRSATGLKPDAIINISYTVTERPPGWVGPGETPVLEDRTRTVAYLAKDQDSGAFRPAAGIMSFSNF